MNARTSIATALASALLFGASTPFVKALATGQSPITVAALLYLGSGIGLACLRLLRHGGIGYRRLPARDFAWLVATMLVGGAIAPVLLVYGMATTSASTAALLLNLEAVLTAALAWLYFGEATGPRVLLGMACIVAGGVALAWMGPAASAWDLRGALAIAGACLCWALDNNWTRKIAATDPILLASTKGIAAGASNTALALALGAAWPRWPAAAELCGIGLVAYGISLALFVSSLRDLGTARASAYFSTAPFIGAALAIGVFREAPGSGFWIAVPLMGLGVWLHVTERHVHSHAHAAQTHGHLHRHDAHHQHAHDFPWDGAEPHSHPHEHGQLVHAHAHYPDMDHRHTH